MNENDAQEIKKLEDDIIESETKLVDKLIEEVDDLSDDYIRMTLMQLRLGRHMIKWGRLLTDRK